MFRDKPPDPGGRCKELAGSPLRNEVEVVSNRALGVHIDFHRLEILLHQWYEPWDDKKCTVEDATLLPKPENHTEFRRGLIRTWEVRRAVHDLVGAHLHNLRALLGAPCFGLLGNLVMDSIQPKAFKHDVLAEPELALAGCC